jgi:hypothetical protein
VLEHEALGGGHRRLGLVPVRALGEREEPRYAGHDLLLDGRCRPVPGSRRDPRSPRVDAEAGAHVAEGGAVWCLVSLSKHLVDVLVRHLVLEHLDDHTPSLLEDERKGNLQGACLGDPATERCP